MPTIGEEVYDASDRVPLRDTRGTAEQAPAILGKVPPFACYLRKGTFDQGSRSRYRTVLLALQPHWSCCGSNDPNATRLLQPTSFPACPPLAF